MNFGTFDQFGYYRNLLDALEDAVIAMDSEKNISFMNKSARLIFGFEVFVAAENSVSELLQFKREEEAEKLLDQFLADCDSSVGAEKRTAVLRKRDGVQLSVEYSIKNLPGEGGSVLGRVIVFRDVTDRQTQDRWLRDFTSKLKADVVLRDQLLQKLAHDARNPLTVAKMSAQLLLRAEKGNRNVESSVGRITSAVEKVDELVEECLSLTSERDQNLNPVV